MRILIVLGFNIAVAVALYFFGASLTTCWFTFLALCGFAVLGELSERFYEIERKLDTVVGVQAKTEEWTDVVVHALARIENKLDAIHDGE